MVCIKILIKVNFRYRDRSKTHLAQQQIYQTKLPQTPAYRIAFSDGF